MPYESSTSPTAAADVGEARRSAPPCAPRTPVGAGRVAEAQRDPIDVLEACEVLEVVGADVELAVAEAIDPEHLGDDGVAVGRAGAGWCRAVSTPGRPRRRGRISSTPLQRWAAAGAKMSRPANVAPADSQLVLGVRQLDRPFGAARHRHRRCQQPVVRADHHAARRRRPRSRPPGGWCRRRDRRRRARHPTARTRCTGRARAIRRARRTARSRG